MANGDDSGGLPQITGPGARPTPPDPNVGGFGLGQGPGFDSNAQPPGTDQPNLSPFIRNLFGQMGQPLPLQQLRANPFMPWFGRAAPYQPYIPAARNRGMRDIGRPDWLTQGMLNYRGGAYPDAPQANDMPGMISGLARFFGQNGSPMVAMPMLGSAKAMLAFWKAYQTGQMQKARLHHEEMLDQMKMADYQAEKENRDYADALAEFGPSTDDKGNVNPGDMVKLKSRLEELAAANNDHKMQAYLAHDDINGIVKMLQHRDGGQQDLQRMRLQLEIDKLKREAKSGSEWDDTGAAATPAPSTPTPTITGGPAGTAPVAPPPGTPTGTTTGPVDAAAMKAGAAKSAEDESAASGAAFPGAATNNIDELARWGLRGGQFGTNIPKEVASRAHARQMQLQRQLDAIANNPNLTGDQVLNAVGNVDSGVANEMIDTAKNLRGIPQGGRTSAGTAYWGTLTTLMRKYKPGWLPYQFDLNKDVLRSFNPDRKLGFAIFRSARMANLGAAVMDDINKLGASDWPSWNEWRKFILTQEGDERYTKLMQDYLQFVGEAVGVKRFGTGAVWDQQEALKLAPFVGSPAQLRTSLQSEMLGATSVIDEALGTWKNIGASGTPPDFNQETYDKMKAITRLKPNGKIEGKVPESLKPYLPGYSQIQRGRDLLKRLPPDDPRRAAIEQRLRELEGGE